MHYTFDLIVKSLLNKVHLQPFAPNEVLLETQNGTGSNLWKIEERRFQQKYIYIILEALIVIAYNS